MPFEQTAPRPFTSNAVRMYAPVAPGLYGISNAREWIYIGVADDIQNALMAILNAPHTPLMDRTPTGFVFELCDRGRWIARQDRLVLEYEPVCSRHPSQSWRPER